jgi:hypothetical protein
MQNQPDLSAECPFLNHYYANDDCKSVRDRRSSELHPGRRVDAEQCACDKFRENLHCKRCRRYCECIAPSDRGKVVKRDCGNYISYRAAKKRVPGQPEITYYHLSQAVRLICAHDSSGKPTQNEAYE